MYITLVVPTLTQYTRLHKMLETIKDGTRRPNRIVVIDNGIGCDSDLNFWGLHDSWVRTAKNLGVAGSCNAAMRLSTELVPNGYWLHANDDIEVSYTLVDDLAQAAIANPDGLVFSPLNNAGSAFTFFLMNTQKAIAEIGWWDEEFFPAYYEDNDYAYRMGLRGHHWIPVDGGSYIHHTSSTKAAYTGEEIEWGHQRFRANQQRYLDKWGGLPGEEKFTIPFNGEK